MFLEGLRFGLLLQFAVGPVCLMVFITAGSLGFPMGALAALAVTLVDGFYIFLAATGVSVFLQRERTKKIVRFAGAAVLILFGLDIVAGALGLSFLPQIALFTTSADSGNVFLRAILMTASNPLTIVFWGGVFSANVASKGMNGTQLLLFGAGCAAATFVFLNGVALAGTLTGTFLPPQIMVFLNVCVGIVIIFFALKMAGILKSGS
ncbi:MAG: LysE family translocator [Synergistaceae bacterium]|jgi:threonine/homoserine/homoserine lactone efflux protein|nr:LysE family translocator [Synergistaceae bacterium]